MEKCPYCNLGKSHYENPLGEEKFEDSNYLTAEILPKQIIARDSSIIYITYHKVMPYGEELSSLEIPINYCPKCGRKLD